MKFQTVIFLTLTLFITGLSLGCSKDEQAASQTVSNLIDSNKIAQHSDLNGVVLNNPSYSEEFLFKESVMQDLIMNAAADYLMLLGHGRPYNYEYLLQMGSLPIIIKNRYTGMDMINTPDYSPGDIYLDLDLENRIYYCNLYMGNQDAAYQPDAVPEGEIKPWNGFPLFMTDGRTLFTGKELSQEEILPENIDPGPVRERFNIPPDDEARTRIFLVYEAVDAIMSRSDGVIGEILPSLDEYINLIGKKNPVAWINPYTDVAMQEVPWVDVSVSIHHFDDSEIEQPISLDQSDIIASEIAGNYSFRLAPSPAVESENRAYAQFYFYHTDGTLGAYQCMAIGPQEHLLSSHPWLEMAAIGGG
jgi:hypothetical protein